MGSLIGVEEKLNYDLNIKAYPNPTSDMMTLALNLIGPTEKLSIEVYDLLGRRCDVNVAGLYQNLSAGLHEFKITEFGEPGIYTIKINVDGISYFTKVISLK